MKIEYTKDNPLRCFFAFEGYNSQGLALNRLKQQYPDFDWLCVGRSEIDKYAIQAADALFPEAKDKNYGDISKIDWNEVPDFDLFTMSVCCQDISSAGQQKGFAEGSGTRSSLLWECRRAILSKKPKYIVFENVKALVSQKFLPYFIKWQNELASYGYSNFAKVLNSSSYGIPQNRERIFMVSILEENASYHFPEPFPLDKRLKDVLEEEVDEKYYLSQKLVDYVFSNGGKDGNIQGATGVHDKNDEFVNTITANYYTSPRQGSYLITHISDIIKKDIELRHTGLNSKVNGQQPSLEYRVYDVNGISTAITTGFMPSILAPKRTEYGKRVRKKYESGELKESRHNMQELEPRNDGVCNTITSVQKDNLIIEPFNVCDDGTAHTIKAQYYKNGMANFNRTDGLGATGVKVISPTIVANTGGNLQPKILSYTRDANGKVVDRHFKDVANTIHGATGGGGNTDSFVVGQNYRIRKLTPRECFRLQDVDDEYIDKLLNAGISNSQLYKLAGNSITLAPLYHIFRKLFIEKENENKQLTLF